MIHSDRYGLLLRRKTRTLEEELIDLSFNTRADGSGDQKWLKLTANYKDTDLVISRAIDHAREDFDSNIKRNAGGPVRSSLGIHQRQALSRFEQRGTLKIRLLVA